MFGVEFIIIFSILSNFSFHLNIKNPVVQEANKSKGDFTREIS